MKKYSPDDIKKVLHEIANDPQTLKASGKTTAEIQKAFKELTKPKNLDILAEVCSMLDEMPADEGRE